MMFDSIFMTSLSSPSLNISLDMWTLLITGRRKMARYWIRSVLWVKHFYKSNFRLWKPNSFLPSRAVCIWQQMSIYISYYDVAKSKRQHTSSGRKHRYPEAWYAISSPFYTRLVGKLNKLGRLATINDTSAILKFSLETSARWLSFLRNA